MAGKPGRRLGSYGYMKKGLEATEHPTSFDIVWLAGIFEGEGTAYPIRGKYAQCSIPQSDRWILDRIRSLFGGTVRHRNKPSKLTHKDMYQWYASGPRARGILMTIYKFLSPRRKTQIRRALGVQQ